MHGNSRRRRLAPVVVRSYVTEIPAAKLQGSAVVSDSNMQQVSLMAALVAGLQRTAQSVSLAKQPLASPNTMAAFVQQLQNTCGMDAQAIIQLLAKRPVMCWQHMAPDQAGSTLQLLQQQLPALQDKQRLAQLIVKAPSVLTAGRKQLSQVLHLLQQQLELSQQQMQQVIVQHPVLLWHPVQQVSKNMGYLVGLGFQSADLREMVVKSPYWMTKPLRELTVQWQFVTSVIKGSQQDVVLLPELLTLPISSRMGPRMLYARKRHLKLLLPSHAAMLPALATQHWLKQKLVPLGFWLKGGDKAICKPMGLSLEDYKRFKSAWARLDGTSWMRGNVA
eukprot:GHRR01008870.1.p1 GENE.GHRR01008870.1~~GHRR01008870.1.p1  ORF type:complete len:366 (+),score=130.94 GHRR01008870.1:98-1099(+)